MPSWPFKSAEEKRLDQLRRQDWALRIQLKDGVLEDAKMREESRRLIELRNAGHSAMEEEIARLDRQTADLEARLRSIKRLMDLRSASRDIEERVALERRIQRAEMELLFPRVDLETRKDIKRLVELRDANLDDEERTRLEQRFLKPEFVDELLGGEEGEEKEKNDKKRDLSDLANHERLRGFRKAFRGEKEREDLKESPQVNALGAKRVEMGDVIEVGINGLEVCLALVMGLLS